VINAVAMMKTHYSLLFLIIILLTACAGVPEATLPSQAAVSETAVPVLPTQSPTPTSALSAYAFPASIDPQERYLFYLHGKIIEDQGLPAISSEYWED